MENLKNLAESLDKKKAEAQAKRQFVSFLLGMTGADIIAPEEVSNEVTSQLNIHEQESLNSITTELSGKSAESKAKILLSAVITTLTHSEVDALCMEAATICGKALIYVSEHPEVKKEIDPKDLMDKVFK